MNIKTALIGFGIACALGVVGEMDYQDQLIQEQQYCENVKSGEWPKFKQSINCDEVK